LRHAFRRLGVRSAVQRNAAGGGKPSNRLSDDEVAQVLRAALIAQRSG
jgi:hypothetical protein